MNFWRSVLHQLHDAPSVQGGAGRHLQRQTMHRLPCCFLYCVIVAILCGCGGGGGGDDSGEADPPLPPDPPGVTNPPPGTTDPPSGITDPPSGITDPPAGITDPPSGITDPPSGITDPVIVSPADPPNLARVGQPFRYAPVRAADGTPVRSVFSLPEWLEYRVTSGEFVGTPTASHLGEHHLWVSWGSVSERLPLRVACPPLASVQPVSDVLATVDPGVAYEFTVTTDGNCPGKFSIENQPHWASFNADTGHLHGTPGVQDMLRSWNVLLRDEHSWPPAQTRLTLSVAAFRDVQVEAVLGTGNLQVATAPDEQALWMAAMTELIRYERGLLDPAPTFLSQLAASSIKLMLERLRDGNYSFSLPSCCTGNADAYRREFADGADGVYGLLQAHEQAKHRLFGSNLPPARRLPALLLLLADTYRQQVRFPMHKSSAEPVEFMRSLYADHVMYQLRDHAPAQPDTGSFARAASAYSDAEVISKTVTVPGRSPFTAAGVYALPGRSFQVTSMANNPADVSIAINSIRHSSTDPMADYDRPQYVQSRTISLAPGETLRLTSSYGGPVQIWMPHAPEQQFVFRFIGVGQHPFWHWQDAPDDAAFAAALAADEYDWAELVTPYFEVHSKAALMGTTLRNQGTASQVSAATTTYLHGRERQFAGQQGPGIPAAEAEVQEFVETLGTAGAPVYDGTIQHMNSDKSSCGQGCAGNPYDAQWAFNPISHGDLHEVGHGLEQPFFLFDDWHRHALTDLFGYYATFRRWQETGAEISGSECQSWGFQYHEERVYQAMQTALAQHGKGQAYRAQVYRAWQALDDFPGNAQSLTDWVVNQTFYAQLSISAQHSGALQSGWNLFSRLHALYHAYKVHRGGGRDVWLANRRRLGFDSYSHSEAWSISHNDWMAVAISFVTRRDYRDYLHMWGLEFSAKASAQVQSYGLTRAPQVVFRTTVAPGFCAAELDYEAFPVDGTSSWSDEPRYVPPFYLPATARDLRAPGAGLE